MYFYFYFLLYVYYFFYLFSIFSVLVIHKSTMWINSQVNKQQICTNHCHSLEHQQHRNTLLKVQKLFFTLFYCFILPCSLTHSCSIVHRFLPVAGCDDSSTTWMCPVTAKSTGPESTWTWLHAQAVLWDMPPIRWPRVTRSVQGRKSWKGLRLSSLANDHDLIHMLIINTLLLIIFICLYLMIVSILQDVIKIKCRR